MKRLLALVSAIFLSSVICVPVASAQGGSIRGTVMNEKGLPVTAAQVRIIPLDGAPRASLVREAETDERGRFVIGNLQLESYKVFAMKESAGYPDTDWAFYSNHVFPTATLSSAEPSVDILVRIGPPAGVLTGSVTDAVTHAPVNASFLLRRATNPNEWVSVGQRSEYRLLIPPSTDVSMEVSAPGYKTWYYSGASDSLAHPPLQLKSGETTKLDIQLAPEEQQHN